MNDSTDLTGEVLRLCDKDSDYSVSSLCCIMQSICPMFVCTQLHEYSLCVFVHALCTYAVWEISPAPFSQVHSRLIYARRNRPFGDCNEKISCLVRHFTRHGDLATTNFPHWYVHTAVVLILQYIKYNISEGLC